jgi:hypothetical protein
MVIDSTPKTAHLLCRFGKNMGVATTYAKARNVQTDYHLERSIRHAGIAGAERENGRVHTLNTIKLAESKMPGKMSTRWAAVPRTIKARRPWVILKARIGLIMANDYRRR